MTKSELLDFLQPFSDDVEIDILAPNGTIAPLDKASYRIPDGEGRILLVPATFADHGDEYWNEKTPAWRNIYDRGPRNDQFKTMSDM